MILRVFERTFGIHNISINIFHKNWKFINLLKNERGFLWYFCHNFYQKLRQKTPFLNIKYKFYIAIPWSIKDSGACTLCFQSTSLPSAFPFSLALNLQGYQNCNLILCMCCNYCILSIDYWKDRRLLHSPWKRYCSKSTCWFLSRRLQ